MNVSWQKEQSSGTVVSQLCHTCLISNFSSHLVLTWGQPSLGLSDNDLVISYLQMVYLTAAMLHIMAIPMYLIVWFSLAKAITHALSFEVKFLLFSIENVFKIDKFQWQKFHIYYIFCSTKRCYFSAFIHVSNLYAI